MKIRKPLFFLLSLFITGSLSAQSGGVAGVSPAEGVVENAGGIADEGDTSPAEEADINLPHIYTYIDAPVVEQRQVFTAKDIEDSHFADLAEVVEQSGIQILSYGTYGLEQKPSIRGFTDETVRVVVDGICMNNAQTGTFDFSSININSIEKIEIVRGGFTEGVEDEGAVGGVIYITTKKQSLGRNLTFNSSIKSYTNTKTSPLTLDTFSQKLGLNQQFSEKSFLNLNGAATFAQNRFIYKNWKDIYSTQKDSAVLDGSFDGLFSYYFDNGNYWALSERFYKGSKDCPGTMYPGDEGHQNDTNNTVSFTLFNPAVLDLFNLKNIAAYTKQDRTYKSNSDDSHHIYDNIKYSVSAEIYNLKKIKQTASFSFEYTHLNSTNSGIHNQVSGVFKETTKFYINNYFSASIPMALKFCGKNLAFVPKLGFAITSPFLDIKIDGYRMIQFPNMDDLYWNGGGFKGNPDLKPEKGWGADLTFDIKNKFLPFSLNFFANTYEDKITWSGNRTKNEKSAFYFGIDFNLKKTFFNDIFELRSSGEYLYNRLTDKSDSLTYGNRIMWTPDFTGTLSAKLNFKKWDFTLTGSYTGKRYKSNLNISYLEPYTLLDLAVNVRLWKHLTPYLKIDNIFNTSYQSIEDYPMPGRSITLGVSGKF